MTHEASTAKQTIELGRQAWGEEQARRIFGRLICAITDANLALQPPKPVDVLQIQIADIPLNEGSRDIPRILGLHTKWSGFSLILDAHSPKGVYDTIYPTVFHETARVHIYQYRVMNGIYGDNDELTALDAFIEDGMTVCAVEEALGEEAIANDPDYRSYDIPPQMIASKIREFVAFGGRLEEVYENAARFGTPEFIRPGYRVGHAIVRAAMNDANLDVIEMLRRPPEFYRHYAQKLAIPR